MKNRKQEIKVNLIKVSSDNVHVSSECFQVVVALLCTEVSCAEDVLNLARHQQLFEFGRQGVASVGNVQVT